MPRTRQQPRQTRLSFTPLPSSSPAAKDYNKQIQDRAAAVRIQNSPSKRKRRTQADGAGAVNESLPTPAATSNGVMQASGKGDLPTEDEEDDSDDLILPSQKRRKTSRQQRLDFSNTRDASCFDAPVTLSSSGRARASKAAGIFGSQKRGTVVVSSDEESDTELVSPAKLARRGKSKKGKNSKPIAEEENIRMTRSKRASSPVGEDLEEERLAVSSPKHLPLPVEADDEEDEMPSTMATQRRKKGRAKRQTSPDSFISSSPPLGPIDSDDDLEIIEKPTPRRGRASRQSKDTSDAEDAEPITPGRRKLQRRKFTQQEKEDLADDLDFLGPSSDAEDRRRPRDTQSTQKAARLSALQKLKQKRSSQPGQTQSSRSHPVIVEDEEDGEEDESELHRDRSDREEDDFEETQSAPLTSRQYFTANDEDEAFIESEGEAADGTLGYPDHNMPIEFTQYARMKPKELFPYAVEWMVQRKINPAFSMDDELYSLTFRKIDDEVKGLAGSKFTSSAWTEDFTFALRARPDIAYEPLDRSGEHYMNDHCDACNRSGHPATFRVQFQGKPYHRDTLEEVNNDDDDGSDSDSDSQPSEDGEDQPSWDAEGRSIVPASKVFFVGKFCQANAVTAHALQHWRFHLNEWVVSWLSSKGYLRPAEIVKRDGWNEKKRRKAANKMSDRMEKEGVVQQLWRDFRNNIDEARNAKQGRF